MPRGRGDAAKGLEQGQSGSVQVEIILHPGGTITLSTCEEGEPMSLPLFTRISAPFERSTGNGLLHLGLHEIDSPLPAPLDFFRELARRFLMALCTTPQPAKAGSLEVPAIDASALEALTAEVPFMRGAEYCTAHLLSTLWGQIEASLRRALMESGQTLEAFLSGHDSVWHTVGRVCFHLAQNGEDPMLPFAFLATYVHKVSNAGTAAHRPLSAALEEYAGAGNHEALLHLLTPIMHAVKKSSFLRDLYETGDIYLPVTLTAQEAHTFLREIPLYREAGLTVRIPDWWREKHPPYPRLTITIGQSKTTVGGEALLSFDARATLGGAQISQAEIKELLAQTEGLRLMKGQWIEVDHRQLVRLLEILDQGDRITREGVTFSKAVALIARSGITETAIAQDSGEDTWTDVRPGEWFRDRLSALRDPSEQLLGSPDAGLAATLRHYQRSGLNWLNTMKGLGLGGCLADDMGLGKTIQVLGLLNQLREREEPGLDLLVVPATLLTNWQEEAARFAPQLNFYMAHRTHGASTSVSEAGLPEELGEAHAVVTTYGTLVRTPWMLDHPWRCVVLDEAQAIKNPAAKQTRTVKRLTSRWRLALTGTPIENRLGDLWSLFDFLNPGLLGTRAEFAEVTRLMTTSRQGYAPLRALVRPYILRRLKTDRSIISDLPDKTEVTAWCLLTRKQVALYQEAVSRLAKSLAESLTEEGVRRKGLILAALMRFKQLCNHPSQLLGDGSWDPTESGKFERLRAIAETIAERQEKMLIFTQFREMTGPLASFLAQVFNREGVVLHGGTPVRRRQELVHRFQTDEMLPFMVLSLKAGGTGLNLTAASHVVHFDRWWNPAVEDQATDRAFRIGQHKNVLVHRFVCRGTIEERIDQLIAEKRELSDELLASGHEQTITEMSDEEILSMVTLNLDSAMEGDPAHDCVLAEEDI